MFTINQHSKIAAIIRANKDSIPAIASLARPLEKLKNPLLRKLLAARVTVAEAAKIGGCTLQDFAAVLAPLGFTFEFTDNAGHEAAAQKPAWLTHIPEENIRSFDVRPLLAAGNDPLKAIMQQYSELQGGSILRIVNSFIPYPLIKLLEKKKAQCFTAAVSAAEYHTWFLKPAEENTLQTAAAGNVFVETEQSFATVCSNFSGDQISEIDVRQLEMPGPMERILQYLEQQSDGQALYVYHKRVPVYLLEELADKAWHIHILTYSATDTRLLIFKNLPVNV